MTRHLLRLIWNRRRANFLIITEIFFAFLVLFAVVVLALQMANNYRQPLGYDIENVWTISITSELRPGNDEDRQATRARFVQMLQTARDFKEVEAACASFTGPYLGGSWTSGFTLRGKQVNYAINNVTDDCQAVLRLPVTQGRWFSRSDDADSATPIVANERFARDVFGSDPASAIGQIVPPPDDEAPLKPGDRRERSRLVGIVPEFRQHGELSTPEGYILRRVNLLTAEGTDVPSRLLVRVRPGTSAEFEEPLVRRLQAVVPDWAFEVRPLSLVRADNLSGRMLPLTAVGTIAGFLLLMVALGLTGVLWQNVTQRTREIGLRRAKGATAGHIQRQVLGELALMTTLAVLVAVVLLVQVPLLPLPELFTLVPGYVFAGAILLSVLVMYLLTLVCAWYPARLATRIQPADALHYE